MFIFLIIGISLLSFSVLTIMINAQTSSGSTTSGSSSGASGSKSNTATQMGICVVGAGGPCNGDSDFSGIDHNTR
jgi:hypothetical protein